MIIVQKKGGNTADLTKLDKNKMVEMTLLKDEEKQEKD